MAEKVMQSRIDIDGLRKRYGERRALEWFMRAEDQRYWNMTKRRIEGEKEDVMAILKKRMIAITALVIILDLIAVLHSRSLLARN